jgi:hypothetical protein
MMARFISFRTYYIRFLYYINIFGFSTFHNEPWVEAPMCEGAPSTTQKLGAVNVLTMMFSEEMVEIASRYTRRVCVLRQQYHGAVRPQLMFLATLSFFILLAISAVLATTIRRRDDRPSLTV